MKALLCFDKMQDWLEAYSILERYPQLSSVDIIYKENQRNNEVSVKSLFEDFKNRLVFHYIKTVPNSFYSAIANGLEQLESGDIFAAPFIRYRNIWGLVPVTKRKGVFSIHLSESLPDSFGLIGYRFGFRWRNRNSIFGCIKNLLSVPAMYLYAMTHKPDLCFYNMYPSVHNPFVKKTEVASVPHLSSSKMNLLKSLLGNEKRTLIVAGFGYNIQKMAYYYGLSKYIGTSKNLEIIIDGTTTPLSEFICAEDVLMGDFVDKVIGYNSTAICWAYRIGGVEIECFEAPGLDETFGWYNYYSRKTLAKCGIQLKFACHDMIE